MTNRVSKIEKPIIVTDSHSAVEALKDLWTENSIVNVIQEYKVCAILHREMTLKKFL